MCFRDFMFDKPLALLVLALLSVLCGDTGTAQVIKVEGDPIPRGRGVRREARARLRWERRCGVRVQRDNAFATVGGLLLRSQFQGVAMSALWRLLIATVTASETSCYM